MNRPPGPLDFAPVSNQTLRAPYREDRVGDLGIALVRYGWIPGPATFRILPEKQLRQSFGTAEVQVKTRDSTVEGAVQRCHNLLLATFLAVDDDWCLDQHLTAFCVAKSLN